MKLLGLLLVTISLTTWGANRSAVDIKIKVAEPLAAELSELTGVNGTFRWVQGPEWLSLTGTGRLLGTPGVEDTGWHEAKIRVATEEGDVELAVRVHVANDKAVLLLFGAPWSAQAKTVLPETQFALTQQLGADLAKLDIRLVATTGNQPYEAPTRRSAQAYAQSLGFVSPAVPDAWRWRKYRRFFKKDYALPAAVVLNTLGAPAAVIAPSATFANDVVDAVKRLLPNPNGRDTDVLWVIDSSASAAALMPQYQTATAAFLESFRAQWPGAWKMGVISTDIAEKPFLGFAPGAPFTNETAEPVAVFQAALQAMGNNGAAYEEAFQPVLSALTTDPGFRRAQSDLSVIVVTDAPEQGKDTPANFLKALGEQVGGLARARVFGVFAAKDFNCEQTDDAWNYAGSRYEEVIQATGGRAISLCDPQLADRAKELATSVLRN